MLYRVGADGLIDRNRRLLAEAEATRALTQRIVDEVAEACLMLHVTSLRCVHLHFGRTGLLSEMICLRRAIAGQAGRPPVPNGLVSQVIRCC
jgi:hypothetical protein